MMVLSDKTDLTFLIIIIIMIMKNWRLFENKDQYIIHAKY